MNSVLILNWRCPSNPLSGGAEKVTLEHAKAWVKNGLTAIWIAGNYNGGKQNEVIDGVQIFRFGSPILIYFLAPFIYWFKFKGSFDLVIDEIHGIPFLSPLWAWKSKKLVYIHEVAQEIWDEMLPFPINIIGKIYEKVYFFFYRNTLFLTGSNSTKIDLIRYGISEKNITVVPHGLFLKPAINIPKKEKSLTLLYVSRLVKMKGIEEAMKIFAETHKKVLNSKFWIVGGGEKKYLNKLLQLIRELKIENSVTFFGFVSEKKKVELYQKAHFLLHTSVREGFGLVVIEANSQGTPVLAYDSPGLRDVIQNGVNGYIFQAKKYEIISEKCIFIYKSGGYHKLAESSMIYSNKYDWNKISRQSLKLIKNIT